MGKLHTIGNVIIRVYANDHLPPHFHAVGPDSQALILIETLAVDQGSLPVPARKAVLAWAAEHRTEIVREWNRINPRFPVA